MQSTHEYIQWETGIVCNPCCLLSVNHEENVSRRNTVTASHEVHGI